jgi:hypothetical protein
VSNQLVIDEHVGVLVVDEDVGIPVLVFDSKVNDVIVDGDASVAGDNGCHRPGGPFGMRQWL